MATPDTSTALHDRWRPWLDALRQHGTYIPTRENDLAESNVIWIKWLPQQNASNGNSNGNGNNSNCSDGVDASAEIATEALELLALLGEKDPAQWRRLVQSVWPDAVNVWVNSRDLAGFRIGCELRTHRSGELSDSCARFLLEDIGRVVVGGYTDLRAELEAAYKHDDHDDEYPMIPLRLALEEDYHALENNHEIGEETFALLLIEIVQLVRIQVERIHTRDGGSKASAGPLFHVDQVDIDSTYPRQSLQIFRCLDQIAAWGVHLSHLRLDDVDIREGNAAMYTPSLLQLLATKSSTDPTITLYRHVTSISVNQYATGQTYDSIFSALATSQSVQKLSVGEVDMFVDFRGPRPPLRDRLWQWMGVLFTGKVFSPLHKLTLRAVELESEDVRVLERTMRGPDPLSVLFPTTSGVQTRDAGATVSASKFRLSAPKKVKKKKKKDRTTVDDGKLYAFNFTVTMCGLRIIDSGDVWLCVLLPGWGKAWVKRVDALIEKVPSVNQGALRKTSPVRHVEIDGAGQRQKDNILGVLRLIGHEINELTIRSADDPSRPPQDLWLRRTIGTCPRLDALSITGIPLKSLEIVAWGYEVHCCHMTKLVIETSMASGIACAATFFEFLGDNDHLMAKKLRELDLTITPTLSNPLASVLESAIEMLKHNYRLYRFQLCLSVADGQLSEVEWALMRKFASFDCDPVAVPLAPLALPNKLAFLSVPSHQNNTVALSNGDVSLIFQFAAQCRVRRVQVTTKLKPKETTRHVDSWRDVDDMPCPCCSGTMAATTAYSVPSARRI